MRVIGVALIFAAGLQAATYFEPNHGQAPSRVQYTARARTGVLGIGDRQLELVRRDGQRLVMRLEGARSSPSPIAVGLLPGVSHYATGNDPARWSWGVRHYSKLRYEAVYPGIDLQYRSAEDGLEFDFLLAARAEPSRIALRFSEPPKLAKSGQLEVGGLSFHAPVAWQESAGGRRHVEAQFVVHGGGQVTFRMGSYDRNRPLMIDPIVKFATFLGGSENERDTRLAVAPDGALYLAGSTLSPDFPADPQSGSVLNHMQRLLAPDAYVARLSADGSTLEWSLFLGGNGTEAARGLKCDDFGNLYLLGYTSSPNFPVTAGAYRTKISESLSDLFVMKFDGKSGRIKASTFAGLPQNQSDLGTQSHLAIDPAGGVYLAGYAGLPGFTTSPGAYSPVDSTSYGFAAFVVRLNAALSARVYATGFEAGTIQAIDVDSTGSVVLAGVSRGGGGGNPGFQTVKALEGVNQSPAHPAQAYLAKLNPLGTALTLASLLHGDGNDSGVFDVKAGKDDVIEILGWTSGTRFPLVRPLSLEPLPDAYPVEQSISPFHATVPAAGGVLLQATLFQGPAYSLTAYSNMAMRLVTGRSGKLCILGLGTERMQQTAGGLAADISSRSGPLVCTNDERTGLETKTALPKAATPTAIEFAPDGSLLLAGLAVSGFESTEGAAQRVFGGGGYSSDYFYDSGYGDAFLLRLSLENPAPVLLQTAPAALILDGNNSAVLPMELYGTGFAYGASVLVEGAEAASKFATRMKYSVPAMPLNALHAGPNRISVSMPPPGGGTSEITVNAWNGTPGNLTVSPSSVSQGAGEAKVVIRAKSILPDAVLLWNGSPRPAQFVLDQYSKAGTFELILAAEETAQAGVSRVAVRNPAPGGGRSNEAVFAVQPSAGVKVPLLPASMGPLQLNEAAAEGTKLTVNGSGFSDGIKATWDGVEVAAEYVSASTLRLSPPIADLRRWGVHSLTVRNGDFTSGTMRVFVGQQLRGTRWAVDEAHGRLYSAVVPGQYTEPFTLAVLDLESGALLSSVQTGLYYPDRVVVSEGGQYVWFTGATDGSSAKVVIARYDTASGKVDLVFEPKTSRGVSMGPALALLAVPGQPETIAVTSRTYDTFLFDRDVPRAQGSLGAGFPLGVPVFATAARIYFGLPGPGCWQWMEFDENGIGGGAPECQASLPPDAISDSGLVYLSAGAHNYPVAVPGLSTWNPDGYMAGSLAADPEKRRAYRLVAESLTEFDLDSGEQPQVITPPSSFSNRFLIGSRGHLWMFNNSWITPVF